MIKFVVGLGNPGKQYEKTRHNAGFLFLDYLLERYSGAWSNDAKFQGHLAACVVAGSKVVLLKPQTFMNRSGISVGAVARYYKFKAEELLVVHDELDFDVGVVRLKKGGGHAGHNGLRDIIANLGEKDFYRIRLGIGRPASGSVADYVLSNSSRSENNLMGLAHEKIDQYIENIIAGDIAVAMNSMN